MEILRARIDDVLQGVLDFLASCIVAYGLSVFQHSGYLTFD